MRAVEMIQDPAQMLMDFVTELYLGKDECLIGDLIDFNSGIMLPWSRRSDIDRSVKSTMISLIERMDPALFYSNKRQEWRLNMVAYPSLHEAITAIRTCNE